jgi:putative membrane protein
MHRLAWAILLGHVALIVFSTVAMLTVLAGPTGPWLATEPAATVMRVSFRYAGPTYVVLGMLAALAFLAAGIGMARALALAVAATAISLGAELVGTRTGLPFGDYAYSAMLGYRVLGRVPFPIPLSWFYMLVGALAIVARLSSRPAHRASPWAWAAGASLLLLAWDVAMDPAMVRTGHWAWGPGTMFRESGLPAWVVALFTRDVFYGMPLGNWLGWFLTATVVARVMLAIVPPARLAPALRASPLPVALYLANGVMPVALCLRDEAWWAAALGGVAMLVPSALALRPRAESRPATATGGVAA